MKLVISISLLFRYLIRFEPERLVAIFFLYWLLDYFSFSSLSFSCQFFEFLHVRAFRGDGHPMYYGLVIDRPLGFGKALGYNNNLIGRNYHPIAPTPMLHIPICFEISPERESFPCTSYWSPNHCSIIQLCTYIFLAAMDTQYFLFQTFYLFRNILKWVSLLSHCLIP